MASAQYDVVVVGAGPAGCVVASRLSQNAARRVVLVEAGPDAAPGQEHPSVRSAFPVSTFDPAFFWQPPVMSEWDVFDRPTATVPASQGYGVGGGSNVYGMISARGIAADFDDWRDQGAEGWGWADVLPYFLKAERDLDFTSALNGSDGPIPIRRVSPDRWSPFTKRIGDQALARGFPLLRDLNSQFEDGLGSTPLANLPDRRVSAAMAFLSVEVRSRPNLTILSESSAERLLFKGKEAIGIQLRTRTGRQEVFGKQVVLTCGALQSPALLMRSGIGPAGHLRAHGIDVIEDLPGVGQHLMNHPYMILAAFLPRRSMQEREQSASCQAMLRFSSSSAETQGDLGLYIVNQTAWHSLGRRVASIMACVAKPKSTGEVLLKSADPTANPEVRLRVGESDLSRLVEATRLGLELLSAPGARESYTDVFLPNSGLIGSLGPRNLRNSIAASAISGVLSGPGIVRRRLIRHLRVDVPALLRDEARLRDLVGRQASPACHFSCTCRMGADTDPAAVVDKTGRVRGIGGLRVADASIMPSIVRIGSHLPVLMVAEKVAASMLEAN